MSNWIPTNVKMPPPELQVITYFPQGDESGRKISTGHNRNGQLVSDFPNSTAHFFKATHWQPFPKDEPTDKSNEVFETYS